MSQPLVFSATEWNTNAELIADVARLGWLHPDLLTLDPTYGRGSWWKLFRPERLVTHDIKRDGMDFRKTDYKAGVFPQIAYDPPYVAKGGRKTSGIKEMDARYGMGEAPKTPELLQELINDGLTEMYRICARRGITVVKVQKYISSGKLWNGVHKTLAHAEELGFEQVDELMMVRESRLQPKRKRKDGRPVRQHHSRNNCSHLLVLRKAA